jgi:ubiquinone/menaquinone biosynthesis C-methylase UbiE
VSNHLIKPTYGIDAPGIIANFLLIGVSLAITSRFVPSFTLFNTQISFMGFALFSLSLVPIALGLSMLAYGIRGKFNIRDYMLNQIAWQGDETVLDIGTGRGLLLIGAAKRLTTGKAIGIDIWNAKDLTGNSSKNTLRNVELEDVKDRVEIRTEDARHLSFADNSFDVILCVLCLHNIEHETEREVACCEIARVLRPGGTAVLSDYTNTGEYARALAQAGLEVQEPKSYLRLAYGLMWMIVATKVERGNEAG